MAMDEVAIIGAGISGLTLALFLKQNDFDVTVYEVKPPGRTSEGAIALQPNGLRSLNALGIGLVEQVQKNGYSFQALTFRNAEHKFLDKYVCGDEDEFGYNSYRIYRQVFLEQLKDLAEKAGIPIHYDCRFSHVVSEDDVTNSVVFGFADGTQKQASLLVGADGIHSKVRQYVLPEIKPTWSGVAPVWFVTPASKINYPSEDYKNNLPVNIHGPTGAVHIAPQTPEGSEHLVAVQWASGEKSREGWKEFSRDKHKLRDIVTTLGSLNEITRDAINCASDETFNLWPVYTIPKLETWYSSSNRVVILGDAAHAIAPTGGQGANQSIEDVHSLSILLSAVRANKVNLREGLDWWQKMRQSRVDGVNQIAGEIRKRRMPGWTGEGAATIDSGWLFNIDVSKAVNVWVEAQQPVGNERVNKEGLETRTS